MPSLFLHKLNCLKLRRFLATVHFTSGHATCSVALAAVSDVIVCVQAFPLRQARAWSAPRGEHEISVAPDQSLLDGRPRVVTLSLIMPISAADGPNRPLGLHVMTIYDLFVENASK